jgi:non-specific serine/threonine protein kinase
MDFPIEDAQAALMGVTRTLRALVTEQQSAIEQMQRAFDDPDVLAGLMDIDEEYARGRALRTEDAYALALEPLAEPDSAVTLEGLTPTESQIARMVAEGLRTNDIARRTGRSTRTVNTHITRIYQKVGHVNSRPELAMWVQRELLGRD